MSSRRVAANNQYEHRSGGQSISKTWNQPRSSGRNQPQGIRQPQHRLEALSGNIETSTWRQAL